MRESRPVLEPSFASPCDAGRAERRLALGKGEKMRVLIAEDDKPVASFVQKGLEAEQYAVDIAQDGDEAQFMVEPI